MKRLLFLVAVFAAALALFVALTLPPRRLPLSEPFDNTVPGVLHVHTNRSDGLSGPDEIAAAAARAGLKFVVFTDHGDATRTPDPPTYRSGVLCLDGVEISTTGGHYVALDMPASPYPLAGEARDVVEDIRRLGGFGIAAHPDSPKADLRWREWTAPFDGIELVNLDTGWRVASALPGWRPKWSLFKALIDYPFRPAEVIADLIHPTGVLYNWEALTRRRRVVVSAGADAHASLELWSGDDPRQRRRALPFPGYESSFRVMSVHARTDRRLAGDARADGAELVRAIRAGHLYIAVDAAASPASFEFTATNSTGRASQGDELAIGGPVLLRVRSNAPAGFTTIVHDGLRTISTVRDASDLTLHAPDGPGVYWVEIMSTGRPRPATWVRSNPIYVRAGRDGRLPVRPAASTSTPIFDGRTRAGWGVEHDPTSLAELDVAQRIEGSELRLRYGLSGGDAASQFAGLVVDTPEGLAPHDRLKFAARAEHPMRVSIQLRAGGKDRWRRSIYIDSTDQERTVFFDDLMPAVGTETFKPPLGDVRNILFVVDTTNTKPGSSGRLWVRNVALQR